MDRKERDRDRLEDRSPTIANGIDNDEELTRDATDKDVREGNYTKVTKMVWDEYDPSEK